MSKCIMKITSVQHQNATTDLEQKSSLVDFFVFRNFWNNETTAVVLCYAFWKYLPPRYFVIHPKIQMWPNFKKQLSPCQMQVPLKRPQDLLLDVLKLSLSMANSIVKHSLGKAMTWPYLNLIPETGRPTLKCLQWWHLHASLTKASWKTIFLKETSSIRNSTQTRHSIKPILK